MRRGTVAMLIALLAAAVATPGAAAIADAPGPATAAAKKKCKKKGKAGAAAKKCKKKKKKKQQAGEELPPPAQLSINPTSHHFGTRQVGNSSPPQLFTVTNAPGRDDAGAFQVSVTGVYASSFQVSANNCTLGTTLAGGQSCTFQVTNTPMVPAPHSATVVVEAGVGGGVTADVSGIGLM